MSTIYQAIADIMDEGYAITKARRNLKQGYQYRGIDDVMNTFQPLLAKHQVFAVPEVLEQAREERHTQNGGVLIYAILTVKYTFYAADGSHVDAVVVGEGMDSGDKASNKALSAAFKYALFQVFCIPTEEQMIDSETDSPEVTGKGPEAKTETPEAKAPTLFVCDECGEILKPPARSGRYAGTRRRVRSGTGGTCVRTA